jgi:hypothetical protein
MHKPPANGKQGPIPEEMSQTLLTNTKQENLDQAHAANIIKPVQTHNTGHGPYLSLELTIRHQKPNPSHQTV